jgi:D-alanine-D-alanine ligase
MLEQRFCRVAVIKGGLSSEANFSGYFAAVPVLRQQGLDVLVVDLRDAQRDAKLRAFQPEVVLPLALGAYGEDGCLQGVLELLGVPYVGSGVLASSIGMCKPLCKALLQSWGISVADGFLLRKEDPLPDYEELVRQLGSPFLLKPPCGGASLGITLIEDAATFLPQMQAARDAFDDVLLEQVVVGQAVEEDGQRWWTEYAVGALQDARSTQMLPVCEVRHAGLWQTFASKSAPSYRCPPTQLPRSVQARLQDTAQIIYERLGCNGPLRVDMALGADGAVYVYEINTLPGMTRGSAYALACATAGISYEQMWLRTLTSAFHRRLMHVAPISTGAPPLPQPMRASLRPEEAALHQALDTFYSRPPALHPLRLVPSQPDQVAWARPANGAPHQDGGAAWTA